MSVLLWRRSMASQAHHFLQSAKHSSFLLRTTSFDPLASPVKKGAAGVGVTVSVLQKGKLRLAVGSHLRLPVYQGYTARLE